MKGTYRALALLLATASAPPPSGGVTVTVTGLRSTSGFIRACLTTNPKAFPDCSKDRAARTLSVAASGSGVLDFPNLAPGRYAVSLLHDANGNGKVDKFLMIPTEGYGFSRDAPVRFGPPSFAQAAFEVGTATVRTTIRMRYM